MAKKSKRPKSRVSKMSEIAHRNLHASARSKRAISEHAQKPKVFDKTLSGKKGKRKETKNIKIAASVAAAALVLIIAVVLSYSSLSKYSFEKGLNEMIKIDAGYGTSIYTEGLDVENKYILNNSLYFPLDWNKTLIDASNVDPMTADLNKLKSKIEKTERTADTEALLLLVEARKMMLESERLFQLGEAIGDIGSTKKGFSCKDKQYILDASGLLNSSAVIGQEATDILDDILNDYPQTREFLAEESRLKFFDSPFWPIKKEAANNKGVIEHFCPDKK